jgi:enoyl-CoA hydratase/carnithine racemase
MDLEVDRTDAVLTITFNRPAQKNAYTSEMMTDLLELLRATTFDPEVRCVILTGAGENFCSGPEVGKVLASLADRTAPHPLMRLRGINEIISAMHRLPQPIIAKVSGIAAGSGANLALTCDLVVADTSARFGQVFVRRGLSLDSGASWLLPRLVGLHKAKELALFGDMIDAAEAQRIGLVNRVVAVDELDGFVAQWAARLVAGPPIAQAQIKRQLDEAQSMALEAALAAEITAQAVNFATADAAEAIAAFTEKRPARFTGR